MINFYILSYDSIISSLKIICRIIEKAFNQQHKIFVYSPNEQISNEIDHNLWAFKEESFIAHTTAYNQIPSTPIYINHVMPSIDEFTVIVNLTDQQIEPVQDTQKIIELVYNDNEHKTLSRKKFEFYKSKNLILNTYNI